MEEPVKPVLETAPGLCWACKAVISGTDHYCRNCGMGQGSRVPWRYKHWGVILLTLFGLGPFSLYFLWRSPVIARAAKIVYTVLIALLMLFVIDRLYKIWLFYQALLGGMQPF